MSFVSIGFLACGLAVIIPVFIHMIHRQNLRELPFASLRFIRLSEQKTRNKRRIQDLLLLLVRMAVLALIAIGLANPTIRNLSNLWGGAQTSAVIVLDNSASMATVDGGAVRLDAAIAAAEKILDELSSADNVAVILPCGPAFPENGRLFSDQNKVRKILREAKVTHEKAPLAAAVQQARTLLVKATTPSKLIFVISDQQEASWQGLPVKRKKADPATEPADGDGHGAEAVRSVAETEKADLSPSERDDMLEIPIILLSCNQSPKPNVGLVRLDTKNVLPIAQVPIPMTVYLKNEANIEQTRRLEVYVNSVKQYESPEIKLDAEGQQGHPFLIAFDRGGLHKGEVRLVGNDGNPTDDKLYFAMEVDQGIPVAVIKPMSHEIPLLEETYYIERALQTGAGGVSPVRLTTFSKEDLLTEPLQNYAAVIAVNLPAPAPEAAERLVQYVQRGGNLIWTAGENVYSDEFNALDAQFENKLLPAPLLSVETPSLEAGKDAWNIDWIDASNPALSNLASPRDLYTRVLVVKRIGFDLSKGAVPVLARLDDGSPLIVQRRIGAGTVTMFGTSVNVAWSNLPTRNIFLPMINQMIFQLAGVEQTRLQTVAGSPITFTFKEDERPVAVEIIPPSGAVLRRELAKGPDDKPTATFVFGDTDQVGVYLLRPLETARQTQIPFSVNLDGDEIDAPCLTEESSRERFEGTPVVFTLAGDGVDSTFDQLKRGTSLWDMFLWGVLLVLVFEAFISNQLSQRREDKEKGIDPRSSLPNKAPSLA